MSPKFVLWHAINVMMPLLLSVGGPPAAYATETDLDQWARVNGHMMHYFRAGSGPPVLLLHGGGDSGEHAFANQIGALVEAGHQVIAPDQVGQGRTPDQPGPLHYAAMMEDTAALLRQLRLASVDVLGFSDGGILGLMLAIRHPDLVDRLAVSGVNVSPDGLPADHLDALRAELGAAADGGAVGTWPKLGELWLNSPTDAELNLSVLAAVSQPVLLMAGDHDLIRLDHTVAIFQALPNAQLFILPDTGHGTFSTRPDLINPVLIRFLTRS